MPQSWKSLSILIWLFFLYLQIEAVDINTATPTENSLETPTSLSLTISPASIDISTTLSTTTLKNASIPRLYLPLSTDGPDPLGVSKVSAFYGPGAFTGWYITIIAAWFHELLDIESKHDINAWIYILSTNWAALDFLQHLAAALRLGDSTVEGMKEMGQLGAAFTTVFWGTSNALLQFGLHCIPSYTPRKGRLTLNIAALRLLLPMSALTVAFFKIRNFSIPALYWEGEREFEDGHAYYFGFACLIGLWGLIGVALLYLKRIYSRSKFAISDLFNRLHHSQNKVYLFPGYFLVFLLCIVAISGGVCFSCIPAMAIGLLGVDILNYIFVAYTPWGSVSPSQCCYFMPCAPQSISETRQVLALVAGLFTFLGMEIVPFVFETTKKSRKHRKRFEEEVGRKFKMEMIERKE